MADQDEHDDPMDLLSILLLHQQEDDDDDEEGVPEKGLPADHDAATLDCEDGEQRYHLSSIKSTLVIRQLRSQGISFQLWPAADSLVSLIDRRPSTLLLPPSQLRILEVGSGTGLVGIAAAAILGARVTLTDLPHVLPNLRFNVEANAAAVAARGGSLDVRQLRWGEEEDAAAVLDGGAEAALDVVMASDVVYYEHLIEPLLRTLRALVKGEVAFVMAHLRRWKKRDAVFFRKARKLFDVGLVHIDPPLPGKRVGVAIYRFTTAKKATKYANIE